VTPEPSRVHCRRTRSSERVRTPPQGGVVESTFRSRPGSTTQGCSFPERRKPIGGPRFSGETEDWALVENLTRVVVDREVADEPTVRQDPGVPGVPSFETRREKRRRVGSGKPGPGREGKCSGEAKKSPREYRLAFDSGRATGTDPRREENLEAAGHRDLLVLRAAERDVMNGKKGAGAERRTALRGGKALKGEPHEWHRPSWPEGVGGSKPSRG